MKSVGFEIQRKSQTIYFKPQEYTIDYKLLLCLSNEEQRQEVANWLCRVAEAPWANFKIVESLRRSFYLANLCVPYKMEFERMGMELMCDFYTNFRAQLLEWVVDGYRTVRLGTRFPAREIAEN